ncbi:MAG: hypothetical protein IJ446_10080 [Oscillospiraceae bacterium]|nr:hypothetical protein [Oscillospiraceae bacterium]
MLKSRKSNKTASVMKLLTGNQASNPIIDKEFKEDVIRPIEEQRTRAAIEAASPKAAAPVSAGHDTGETEVNIASELVSEWLSPVLERFGCCRCGRCMAEASVEAFERLPMITVKVRSSADLEKVKKIKAENKQKAMMILVSIASARKNMPKHGIT